MNSYFSYSLNFAIVVSKINSISPQQRVTSNFIKSWFARTNRNLAVVLRVVT